MDPKFQTSFIPKKPIDSNTSAFAAPSIPTVNIFSTLATAVFILTIILIGGLYGYKYYLNGQIEKAGQDLAAAQTAFQPDAIKSIIEANSRIKSVKQLLNDHVAVSELFGLLQSLTLKKVSFSGFNYSNKEGTMTVSMNVEAQSYNALTQQYNVLKSNDFIKNPQFSDFELGESGNVKTKLTAVIDPSLTSYKKAIEALNQ